MSPCKRGANGDPLVLGDSMSFLTRARGKIMTCLLYKQMVVQYSTLGILAD